MNTVSNDKPNSVILEDAAEALLQLCEKQNMPTKFAALAKKIHQLGPCVDLCEFAKVAKVKTDNTRQRAVADAFSMFEAVSQTFRKCPHSWEEVRSAICAADERVVALSVFNS